MRQRDPDKEKRVYLKAIEVINELGFHGASIAKIAKEAGVSPATIYIYFQSREDMINQIYMQLKLKMVETVFSVIDRPDDLSVSIKKLWLAYIQWIFDNETDFCFLEQCANSPLIDKGNQEKIKKVLTPYIAMLESGRKQHLLKQYPIEVLNSLIHGPILHMYKSEGKEWLKSSKGRNLLYQAVWDSIRY
ncbi:MAG: hypothetical protein CMP10_18040 [Zetaproteobacteria bacterium]|nr:hypothetical protein [Pseudobdellovibrionaceae bacterium]